MMAKSVKIIQQREMDYLHIDRHCDESCSCIPNRQMAYDRKLCPAAPANPPCQIFLETDCLIDIP